MKTSNKILSIAFSIVLISVVSLLFAIRYRIAGDIAFGNSRQMTHHVHIEDFTKVVASDGIQVFFRQSDSLSLSYTADSNLADVINIYTADNTLYVNAKRTIISERPVQVHITGPKLEAIDISKAAWFHTEDSLFATDFSMRSAQGANLFIRGRFEHIQVHTSEGSLSNVEGVCTSAEIHSASGSRFNADSLPLDHCKISTESGALNNLCVGKTLAMDVRAGALVYYHGDPAVSYPVEKPLGRVVKK